MALFKKPATSENQTTNTPTPVGRTQTLALTAFVVSFFESIIPIVLGHVALKNYKNEEDQTWRGFAVAGLILGYVGLVLRIKLAALIVLALAVGGAAKTGHTPYNMIEKTGYSQSCPMETREMGKKYDKSEKYSMENMKRSKQGKA